jgi:hypothetical protein
VEKRRVNEFEAEMRAEAETTFGAEDGPPSCGGGGKRLTIASVNSGECK